MFDRIKRFAGLAARLRRDRDQQSRLPTSQTDAQLLVRTLTSALSAPALYGDRRAGGIVERVHLLPTTTAHHRKHGFFWHSITEGTIFEEVSMDGCCQFAEQHAIAR